MRLADASLRCGLFSETGRYASALAGAAPQLTPARAGVYIEVLRLRAQLALNTGNLEVATEFTEEFDRSVDQLQEDVLFTNDSRRSVALLYASLERPGDARRVAAAARRTVHADWPERAALHAEIALIETHAAVVAGEPVDADTSAELIEEWLAKLATVVGSEHSRFGEHMIRMAPAMLILGAGERALALLRSGIELIRRGCGDFHADLQHAEAELAALELTSKSA
jgi:hypothetical protein